MEILLKKDVANLGYAGEIVKVKAGYAMNYLVPQGFATVATESVKKQHAETLRQRAHKEAKLVADAEALAATLNAQTVELKVKVSESGKLYGSVTTMEVGFEDDMDVTLMAVPKSFVISACSVAWFVPTEKSFAPISDTATIELEENVKWPDEE